MNLVVDLYRTEKYPCIQHCFNVLLVVFSIPQQFSRIVNVFYVFFVFSFVFMIFLSFPLLMISFPHSPVLSYLSIFHLFSFLKSPACSLNWRKNSYYLLSYLWFSAFKQDGWQSKENLGCRSLVLLAMTRWRKTKRVSHSIPKVLLNFF